MKLKEFLKKVNGKIENITSYEGKDALTEVKKNGYALKYVKNQTEEICLEAVKQNGYALMYVKNQTEEICLEAVKQNWYALRYVNPSIFEADEPEYTMEELTEKIGHTFKIIKK